MTKTLNLTARPQGSRVLGAWLSEREGAAERAGIVALGENSTGSLNLSELTAMIGASSVSASGASVTADSAMKVSAVYGCVSLIAGAIATLPLGVFERTAEGRDKADHPYWWLFNEQPTLRLLLGGALIIIASVVTSRLKSPPSMTVKPAS